MFVGSLILSLFRVKLNQFGVKIEWGLIVGLRDFAGEIVFLMFDWCSDCLYPGFEGSLVGFGMG